MSDSTDEKELLSEATRFFDGDELAANTYLNKYALRSKSGEYLETTPEETLSRVMRVLADAMPEDKTLDAFYVDGKPTAKLSAPSEEWLLKTLGDEYQPFRSDKRWSWLELFLTACNNFKGVCPQGSILSAAGNVEFPQSLSNCFVINSPEDSIAGIFRAGEEEAQLLKKRGGVGLDISTLRPAGTVVANAARTSTGAVGWMDFFSDVCKDIGQGGRRGALMITLDVKHPDALAFAQAKIDRSYCTSANVSLKISSEFMQAVKDDAEYTQQWPINSEEPKIVQTVNARELWSEIIKCAHECAEPGLIMWDNALNNLPANCYSEFKAIATNPCAEIILSPDDSCRLVSICLTNYIRNRFTKDVKFDYSAFQRDIRVAMRMLDAVVTAEIEHVEKIIKKIKAEKRGSKNSDDYTREIELWKRIQKAAEQGRRTGLGTHGLGDCLAQLCLKYDSDLGLKEVDKIYKTLRDTAYDESVEMAIEYGPFPAFDWEKEKDCAFIKRLPKKLRDRIKQHGRRNISILTNAPTGTISLMSQVSSGIEPTFRQMYTRQVKVNTDDCNAKVDFVDEHGDKWMEYPVFEKNVERYFKAIDRPLPMDVKNNKELEELLPEYFVSSDKIDWMKRVELQATAQKYIDHSISSCLAVGENQYIYTDGGLILIDDFALPDIGVKTFVKLKSPVYSYDHLSEKSLISEVYNNGISDCLRVRLSDGTSIICTRNHKLFCLDENYKGSWKEAEELSDTDVVIGRIGLECFGNSNLRFSKLLGEFIPQCSTKGSYKVPEYPDIMTKDLAYILGCLISDGGYTDNGIFLSQSGNNVLQEFEDKTKKVFKVEGKRTRDNRSVNLYSYVINSRGLRDYVKYLGVKSGAGNKEIPRCIFQCANKEMVKEFIRGLTLDGHIHKQSHNVYVLTSISYKLIRQTKELLNQFGISSNIVTTTQEIERVFPNSDTPYVTKEAWGLYCNQEKSRKFCTEIGFAEDRKTKEALEHILNHEKKSVDTSRVIPDYGLRAQIRESIEHPFSKELPTKLKAFYRPQREGMDISIENILYLKESGFSLPNEETLTSNTHTFSKVLKVENVGERPTYDLHVPKNNSYVVNGIISHNTINLPRNVSVDKVAEIYEHAYDKGLKGVTVYREGSRKGILISDDEALDTIVRSEAPKRPKKLPCEVHFTRVRGDEYIVIIGLLNGAVYEVFFGEYSNQIPKKHFPGWVEKKNKSYYLAYMDIEALDNKEVNINEYFGNKEYAAATRLISMSLRHGVPLTYIIDQLKKSSAGITEFGSAVSRVLKKYIKIEDLQEEYRKKHGDSVEVRMEGGCIKIINKETGKIESQCD
jgi:ribonucleoside-diphosphate reductase alpha chain